MIDLWLDESRSVTTLGGKFLLPCALILAAATWSLFFATNAKHLQNGTLPGSDFMSIYAAAKLASDDPARLYDPQTQRRTEQSLGSQFKNKYQPHLYPPFFSAALMPLAWMSYTTAYWIWIAIAALLYGLAMTLMIWQSTRKLLLAAVLGLANPAFHWVIISGQTTVFALFFCTAAYVFFIHRKFISSGIFFGLLAYRPQFLILVGPLCMFGLGARVRFGFVLSAVSLFLFGAIALTFESYLQYFHLLGIIGEAMKSNTQMLGLYVSIYGFFRALMSAPSAVAVSIIAVAGLAYTIVDTWKARCGSVDACFDLRFAGMITATLLVMSYSLIYDFLLLAPVALVIEKHRGYFHDSYRALLAALYGAPILFFFFAQMLPINIIVVLLLAWLYWEIYRSTRFLAVPTYTTLDRGGDR